MTVPAPTQSAPARPGVLPSDALLVTVGLVAVSTSGPLMAAMAVPALAVAMWRNALAGALLVPAVLLTRREELRGLGRREWRLALGAGVLLALHFATWVPSLRLTTVASATALVATQPVWTALLAALRGTPVGRTVWTGIGIALAGGLLLTGADLAVSGEALLGDGLALLGGVFAAGYVVLGAEVRRSTSTTTYTAVCYSTAALLLLPVCLLTGSALGGYSDVDWLRLLAVVAGAQLLGHSLFNVVLQRMDPTAVSVALLLEIPGAALLAAVFLGQAPPPLALPAAALLLAGLALVVRGSRAPEPAVPVE